MAERTGSGTENRMILIGAGPMGLAAAKAARDDGVVTIVGAVDLDPTSRDAAGRDLGVDTYGSVDDIAPGSADVALLAFSSRLAPVESAVMRLVGDVGCHVVTTCEEMAFPDPETRRRLEAACRRAARSVMVTGANPGFAMDRIPLALAGGCRNVREIRVTRRVDTSTRRRPLVAKTGYGLSVSEFQTAVQAGAIGHVGLEASAELLAEGLGWRTAEVSGFTHPVIDDHGSVLGQHQLLTLSDAAGRYIELDLTMAWNLEDPIDRIEIVGDVGLVAEIRGGYPGDQGTTA
ncbi:MAG: hypothetical protein EHM57_00285, partial [Actinobacteria bacterium]